MQTKVEIIQSVIDYYYLHSKMLYYISILHIYYFFLNIKYLLLTHILGIYAYNNVLNFLLVIFCF